MSKKFYQAIRNKRKNDSVNQLVHDPVMQLHKLQ